MSIVRPQQQQHQSQQPLLKPRVYEPYNPGQVLGAPVYQGQPVTVPTSSLLSQPTDPFALQANHTLYRSAQKSGAAASSPPQTVIPVQLRQQHSSPPLTTSNRHPRLSKQTVEALNRAKLQTEQLDFATCETDCHLSDRVVQLVKQLFAYHSESIVSFVANLQIASLFVEHRFTKEEVETAVCLFAHAKTRFEYRNAQLQLLAKAKPTQKPAGSSLFGVVNLTALYDAVAERVISTPKPDHSPDPMQHQKEILGRTLNLMPETTDAQRVWDIIIDTYAQEIRLCVLHQKEGEGGGASLASKEHHHHPSAQSSSPAQLENGTSETGDDECYTVEEGLHHLDSDDDEGESIISYNVPGYLVHKYLRSSSTSFPTLKEEEVQLEAFREHLDQLSIWNGRGIRLMKSIEAEAEFDVITTNENTATITDDTTNKFALPRPQTTHQVQNIAAWIELAKLPVKGELTFNRSQVDDTTTQTQPTPHVYLDGNNTRMVSVPLKTLDFILLVMHEFRLWDLEYIHSQQLVDQAHTSSSKVTDRGLLLQSMLDSHHRIKHLAESIYNEKMSSRQLSRLLYAMDSEHHALQGFLYPNQKTTTTPVTPSPPPLIKPTATSGASLLFDKLKGRHLSPFDHVLITKVAHFYDAQADGATAKLSRCKATTTAYVLHEPTINISLPTLSLIAGVTSTELSFGEHAEACYLARLYPTLFFKLLRFVCLPYFDLRLNGLPAGPADGATNDIHVDADDRTFFTGIKTQNMNDSGSVGTTTAAAATAAGSSHSHLKLSESRVEESNKVYEELDSPKRRPFLLTSFKNNKHPLLLAFDVNPLVTSQTHQPVPTWYIHQ